MTEGIIPKYKLIIAYDINPETSDAYYQFVFQELIPAMQGIGLYMLQVYHTAYGPYPTRQIEFVSETLDAIHSAFKTDTWQNIHDRFQELTSNYSQKIVQFRDGFQM
jgi:hypothetical protein